MVDVFILTYNRLKYLQQCIESVVKSTIPVKVNIWDNGSADGTKDWIKEHIQLLNGGIFFNSSINYGTAVARNFMINFIDNKWIVVSDDDMYYEPDCFEWQAKAIKLYERQFGKNKIGFVGLNMPWSPERYKGNIFFKKMKLQQYEIHHIRTTPPNSWLINKKALIEARGYKLPPNRLMGYTAFHLPEQLRRLGYNVIRIAKIDGKEYAGCQHTDNPNHPLGFREYYKETGYNEFRDREKRVTAEAGKLCSYYSKDKS